MNRTEGQDERQGAAGWQPATRLVHGGGLRSPFGETSEALYLTSGYVYESAEEAEARFKGEAEGYVYSRYANPTVAMLEERMRLLEGAESARATASGMAAVTASLLSLLDAGDHVVAARALFGSCRYIVETLLPRYGIRVSLVDGRDLEAWRQAVDGRTKAVFFETPTNPTLELIDIAAVAEIAHTQGAGPQGARVIVDNVFATPLLQSPLALGADVVVYSATKHIDGQGRCLGGLVLGPRDFVDEALFTFLKNTGPAMSPFNAWVLLKGLETLPLRVRASSESAARIADHLASKDRIRRVLYPGRADHPQAALARTQMRAGGTLLAFEIEGGKAAAFRFVNALRLVRISNNLGDAKSLVTHPATTTHSKLTAQARAELGIGEGLVRLSVGLEEAEDLMADIDRALAA